MSVQTLLLDFKPFDGELLDLAVTNLTANKTEYLGYVDKEATKADVAIEGAITAGFSKAGGILKTFSGMINGEIAALISSETSVGEADLSTLYDKLVADLKAEAATLGG